jgi:hypothetical protein
MFEEFATYFLAAYVPNYSKKNVKGRMLDLI